LDPKVGLAVSRSGISRIL